MAEFLRLFREFRAGAIHGVQVGGAAALPAATEKEIG